MAADDAAVDVVSPPATVGLGAHDRGELVHSEVILAARQERSDYLLDIKLSAAHGHPLRELVAV